MNNNKSIYSETRQMYELQAHYERKYSKQNIRKIVKQALLSSEDIAVQIKYCETQINAWMNKPSYPQKEESLKFLKESELVVNDLIIDILTQTLPISGAMEMTMVCGLCAHLLPYENYMESVKRMSDIVVIMANCDLYDITQANYQEGTSILVFNKYGLNDEIVAYINQTKFLPPMVCRPRKLKRNTDSPYLLHKAGSFSRKAEPHNGDICLDSMNSFNSTAFSLDIDFLYQVEDELKENDDPKISEEQRQQDFENLVFSTNQVCVELIRSGNKFYLPNFDDSRGRKYRRGYHVNPQGNSYRKAMLNFAEPKPLEMPEDMMEFF